MNVTIFIATFVLLMIIFGGLALLRRPVYRISDENVIRLFELVLAGEATEDDWDVFVEMPIRYDDDLERCRMRAVVIFEAHAAERSNGYLMSDQGLQDLRELLEELKQQQVTSR